MQQKMQRDSGISPIVCTDGEPPYYCPASMDQLRANTQVRYIVTTRGVPTRMTVDGSTVAFERKRDNEKGTEGLNFRQLFSSSESPVAIPSASNRTPFRRYPKPDRSRATNPDNSFAASHGRCEAPRRAVRGRRGLAGAAARPSRRRAVVGERFACAGSARGSTAGRPRPGRAERDPG